MNDSEYTAHAILMRGLHSSIEEIVYSLNCLSGYECYLCEDGACQLGKEEDEDSTSNAYQAKQKGFTWNLNPVTFSCFLVLQDLTDIKHTVCSSVLWPDQWHGKSPEQQKEEIAQRFLAKLLGIEEFLENTMKAQGETK
jgi:hypothetical protein